MRSMQARPGTKRARAAGRRGAWVAVLVLLAASPAAAEELSFTVPGSAASDAADPRVAALDEAFAAATREALAELIERGERTRRRAELDREVVARARLWVASYRVARDRTEGERRVLEVVVKIHRDKLVARLGELGVPVVAEPGPGAGPGAGDGPATPAAGPARRATALIRVTTPAGVVASYGRAAAVDVPGLAPLTVALRASGLEVVPAPATGPAPRTGGELPLDDDSARALAGDARAELAVVVGASAGAAARVRGSGATASLATARLRIVDRAGVVIGEGGAAAGAYVGAGADGAAVPGLAAATAVTLALADARPAPATTGPAAGPAVVGPVARAGEVLVQLHGDQTLSWRWVGAVRDELTARKAVVSVRRLSGVGVTLAVRTTDAPAALARALRGLEARSPGASVRTRAVGVRVEVSISGPAPGAGLAPAPAAGARP